VLALLLAGGALVALQRPWWATRGGRAAPPPANLGRPGGSLPAASTDAATAAERLLAVRARAVLAHDKRAFLSTVDAARAAFYRAQATLFDRMATVPFSELRYQLDDPTDDLASPQVRARYAPQRVYLPEVLARYRLRHQDQSPVLARSYDTFALTRAGWRLAGQGDARPAGDDGQIWDAGPVQTLASARTLVVFHAGRQAFAARVLAAADSGYAQVDAAWSGRWENHVVVLVPNDEREFERIIGERDVAELAAVSASSVDPNAPDRVLGSRIIMNTPYAIRDDPLNLQIVLTHEMTHVATRTLGRRLPLLLVEGFADYVALRPLRRWPLSATRPALARAVRSGAFDGILPSDARFRGQGDMSLAYDEGSSFCVWVVRTFGQARLQALYRSFASARAQGSSVVDATFRKLLGLSYAQVQAGWAAWVRQQLS
jgi:hypothetical protein